PTRVDDRRDRLRGQRPLVVHRLGRRRPRVRHPYGGDRAPPQRAAALPSGGAPMTAEALEPYDAVMLLSFGGPEAPDEVMPFLRRVTAGRGIPDDRLQDVAHHYELFGGRSPINDQNRALIAALEAELKERELEVPVLWGNRNSPPFLADTLRDRAARGLHRLVVITTSAYSSYSSCRQYRENLADALAEVREEGLV